MLLWSIIKRKFNLLILIFILLITSSCDSLQADDQSKQQDSTTNADNHLNLIKKRGKSICGVNDQLPGFSYKEEDGSYSGISVGLLKI